MRDGPPRVTYAQRPIQSGHKAYTQALKNHHRHPWWVRGAERRHDGKETTMTSITSWSSTTYYSPQAKPDKREKPDFSTLDQDGSGGLDESELAAMLAKGPKSASGTSGTNGASSSASPR